MSIESTAVNESVRRLGTFIYNNAGILNKHADKPTRDVTEKALYFVTNYYNRNEERPDGFIINLAHGWLNALQNEVQRLLGLQATSKHQTTEDSL